MIKKMKSNQIPYTNPQGPDEEMPGTLQWETLSYFLKEVNDQTGLIADKTRPGSPSNIAATGVGISCYIAGIGRGFIKWAAAIKRTLIVLKFFYTSYQGAEPDATGNKGFYYHFVDMETGNRAWKSELSRIDTAILLAGILTAGYYFTGENKSEIKIWKDGILKNTTHMVLMPAIIQHFRRRTLCPIAGYLNGNLG